MKVLLPLFCSLALPVLVSAQTPERPDVPHLTAKTAKWSWSENTFADEKGVEVTETVRQQGVEVEVYFTRAPARAYEVQAFFFARQEVSGQPFIYDAKVVRTSAPIHREVLRAEPLLGTVKRTVRETVTGVTGDGRAFIGEASRNSSESGAKVYGWIVRVISAGKVVRMDSNQTSLKKLGEREPQLLDDALIELESAAASEN